MVTGYRLFWGGYRLTWFGALSQQDWTLPYESSLRLFWPYLICTLMIINLYQSSFTYQNTWNSFPSSSRHQYPPLAGALDMPRGSKYPTGACARKVAGLCRVHMLAWFDWFWMFLVWVTSNKLLMLFTVAVQWLQTLRKVAMSCAWMAQHDVTSPWLSFTVGPFKKYQWPTGRPVQTCLCSQSPTGFLLKNNRCMFHHFRVPSFPLLPRWSSSRRSPGHPAHSQRLARASQCSWTNHPRQSQSSHPGSAVQKSSPKNETTLDALVRKPVYRCIWNLSIR